MENECRRLNKARETLTTHKSELEAQVKASQNAVVNVPDLARLLQRIQGRIATLDFKGKRQVLDALAIKVWLDGDTMEITGIIPITDDVDGVIITTHFPMGRGS